MPKPLTIIAIVDPAQYRWRALVEIDRETLQRLCSAVDSDAPAVGSQHDIGPMLARLADLETRERKMGEFAKLLAGFMPKAE